MKKKLLAVLCACAIAFSLAIPVFAESTASEIPNGTKIIFEGTFPDTNTTVSVSVLTGLTNLYVNPYGLPYTIKDGEVMEPSAQNPQVMEPTGEVIEEGITTDGWFSNTAAIRNDSDAKLDVFVTMTTTEKGNVKVIADPNNPAYTSSDNTLYGRFEITKATATDTQNAEEEDIKLIKATNWNDVYTVGIPVGGQTVRTAAPMDAATNANAFSIDAGRPDVDLDTGLPIIVPTYATFRLRGSAVVGSGSGGASDGDASGWLSSDVADVAVAFSFKPHTNP